MPSYQGYTPGIYALAAADAAGIPRGEQTDAYLKAKGRMCLDRVPRVFQVANTLGISRMTDVIHVDASPARCSATLVTTIYEGPDGSRGEGGIDANGARTPPAPFGKDLPDVKASGFDLSGAPTPTPTPPVATAPAPTNTAAPTPASPEAPKTAGCSVDPSGAAGPVAWLMIAGLLRRRRGA